MYNPPTHTTGDGKLKVVSASLDNRQLRWDANISIYRLILLENIGILVYL